MVDLIESADAGLMRFLALTADRAKPKAVAARTVPPTQTNGHARASVAGTMSFQSLVAEVERAHQRIYAPQYGIANRRDEK